LAHHALGAHAPFVRDQVGDADAVLLKRAPRETGPEFARDGAVSSLRPHTPGLQVGGHVIVWFGLPFSLDLYEQANARLHRPGQKHQVTVHHLVAVNTIDERIMRVLETKGDMQQALIDAVKEVRG
jgi:hypothetical protein